MRKDLGKGGSLVLITGMYAVAVAAVWYWGIRLTGNWVHTFMGLGPVAMTALFLFISIPMMERRQLANKPGYSEYRKQTRLLI